MRKVNIVIVVVLGLLCSWGQSEAGDGSSSKLTRDIEVDSGYR